MTKVAQSLSALRGSEGVARGADTFKVSPFTLIFEDGFNTRDYNKQEVKDHIQSLKQAYVDGHYVPNIIVKVKDNQVLIREGHCRTKAVLLAIEEGLLPKDFMFEVSEMKAASEIDQISAIVTTNAGLQLDGFEIGAVYAKLINHNLTEQEISKKVCKPLPQIKNNLKLYGMSSELKALVLAGKASETYAAELYDNLGDAGAIEKIKEVLATGVKKVTPKKVSQINGHVRITKKHIHVIQNTLTEAKSVFSSAVITDSEVTIKMNPSMYKSFLDSICHATGENIKKT